MSVTGSSLGGGRVAVTNIDGIDVDITGEEHQIIVFHTDQPGCHCRGHTYFRT